AMRFRTPVCVSQSWLGQNAFSLGRTYVISRLFSLTRRPLRSLPALAARVSARCLSHEPRIHSISIFIKFLVKFIYRHNVKPLHAITMLLTTVGAGVPGLGAAAWTAACRTRGG